MWKRQNRIVDDREKAKVSSSYSSQPGTTDAHATTQKHKALNSNKQAKEARAYQA